MGLNNTPKTLGKLVEANMLNSLPKQITEEFKSSIDRDYSGIEQGIISNVISVDDIVFAVVMRDNDNDEGHGHYGYYNVKSYENIEGLTLAELSIPTDIVPIGNVVERYMGKRVNVTIQNGQAIFASVTPAAKPLTTIQPSLIRRVRDILEKTDDKDIFGKTAEKVWEKFGVLQEDIKALKGLIYDEEKFKNKHITFQNEGVWGKDTSKPKEDEIVLPTNSILQGLNQGGQKDNDCHLPTKIFSGK